jgi:PPOX class probable F420-dependent enzyme
MGHGVKQRDVIRMMPTEVDEFLQGRRTMNCATMNHDGSIHLVAMWYGFLEGCPALETKAKSQKVQNLRRDSQITCLLEDGISYEELRGVELVGHAEIVDDPERMLELGISVFERYQGIEYHDELRPVVEQMLHKRVVVKINVERVVSWDHGKLGLPSTSG